MEALRDIDAAYAEWEREVEAKANRKKVRSLVRTFCEQYDIELTDERLAEMDTWDNEQLDAALVKIGSSRQWPGM